MPEVLTKYNNDNDKKAGSEVSEILFTVLIGIMAIGGLWLSSSLLLYLAQGH